MIPLDSGSNLLKQMLLLLGAGWLLAPVVRFAERFLWSDWEFAGFLGVMVAVDTAAGLLVAWRQSRISRELLDDLFIKLFAYGATLITIHTLSHHTVEGQPNSILGTIVPYFDAVVYAAILVREALSLNEHLLKLGHPLLPPFLLRRLRRFYETGVTAADRPAGQQEQSQT
jgi:hypothetical protein